MVLVVKNLNWQRKYFRMDTITEISLVLRDKRDKIEIEQCWNSIDSLLKDWEERFSVESFGSEVRLLNERKRYATFSSTKGDDSSLHWIMGILWRVGLI